jgi:hypothetical protein
MMNRTRTTRILTAAGSLALAVAVTVLAGPEAHAADTGSCAAAPGHGTCDGALPGGACTSGSYYVVTSAPLIDDNTGVASWNYGYVQLWWSQTCKTNWARVVVNGSGPWTAVQPIVYRQSGAPAYLEKQYQNVGAGAYVSPMVYAADTNACAYAGVLPNGWREYHATASQYSGC